MLRPVVDWGLITNQANKNFKGYVHIFKMSHPYVLF